MAVGQRKDPAERQSPTERQSPAERATAAERPSLTRRLFTDHPRSLGMSWAAHGIGAVAIGFRLMGAGLACLVHAIVPGWFTQTAGRTVTSMHDDIVRRKAGAANPNAWPDYEI